MLTLFTCPKAFQGHVGRIQQQAIRSWQRLGAEVEVLLVGDDPGVGEFARSLGVRHVPAVERTPAGVPLVSSVFERGAQYASNQTLMYVNADIMLFPGLLEAVRECMRFKRWLMVGRRWNLDWEGESEESVQCSVVSGQRGEEGERREYSVFSVQMSEARGREEIQQLKTCNQRSTNNPPPATNNEQPTTTPPCSAWLEDLKRRAVKGTDAALDYFAFPKGLWGSLPPFALGRFSWDNWLPWEARRRKACLIDASERVFAVHLNHGYSPTGQATEQSARETPESIDNQGLAGGHLYDLTDCSRRLTRDGICVTRDAEHVGCRIRRLKERHPGIWRCLLSWRLRYAVCALFPDL